MQRLSAFSRSMFAVTCFGFLLTGSLAMSGCGGGGGDTAQEEKKEPTLIVQVVQVDQASHLGDKNPDGQYMVAKVELKNMSNKSISANPTDFVLENITDKDEERYSQPIERNMSLPIGKEYGDALKDKVVDFMPIEMYPRLQLERYFVFMVPADAKPSAYQLTFKPAKVSAPLASKDTVINDRRNAPQ